ncbi:MULTISPECIES: hypothetical protein [unclassified Treponema]|uniref:hypothetical protein n=1 Tax=unclassified Treponema TaxID=2638727 RepID=UPI0020A4B13A|nr:MULTISPECIES: hypothetical protein [unclassified Treponema]UTC66284.1 hypothetical protein E4O06_09885 [Treponema sp. OMZ 789]UTC69014.1 hypothetical protein E4O01_10035 [Treponema sp. OMZ 790]UTC71726.1 hypothetical protein E4O02_10125 [Treponema sp. OMZ 791]
MKMKIIKKGACLTCFIGLAVLLNSCILFSNLRMASEEGEASINGKKVGIKEMSSSDKDCLAFGYLNVSGVHMYVQMDHTKDAIYTTPLLMGGGSFCFPPIDRELSFQLIQLRYDNWFTKVITHYTPGLGKKGNIAFTTNKKGLQFIGAYDFIINGSSATLAPYPRGEQTKYELEVLRKMKNKFRKTKWENLIDDRIKEIENEKK